MGQEGWMKRYIKPEMEDLNASRAEGDCITGTGDWIYCGAGNNAITGTCSTGGNAGSCSSGTLAKGECITGDQYYPA